MDYEQILRIVLLSSLGEIEASFNHRLSINHHDLIVCYGMLGIYFGWDTGVIEKSG